MTTTRKAVRDQCLSILKSCGSRGVTTFELIRDTGNAACARRVWDLQEAGHRIRKVNEGRGVYRWIYLGPPEMTQTTLPLGVESCL